MGGKTGDERIRHDLGGKLISGGTRSTQFTLTQKSQSQKVEEYQGNTHYGGLRLNT